MLKKRNGYKIQVSLWYFKNDDKCLVKIYFEKKIVTRSNKYCYESWKMYNRHEKNWRSPFCIIRSQSYLWLYFHGKPFIWCVLSQMGEGRFCKMRSINWRVRWVLKFQRMMQCSLITNDDPNFIKLSEINQLIC